MNDKWLKKEMGENVRKGWVESHPLATFFILSGLALSILSIDILFFEG